MKFGFSAFMQKFAYGLFILCGGINQQVFSQSTQNQQNSSFSPWEVHEAYLTRVSANLILNEMPSPPPLPRHEQIPPQVDNSEEWIPGYYLWVPEVSDFRWVCGIWRKPPPNHQWIPGYWKNLGTTVMRVPGFWSTVNPSQLTFVDTAPPDQPDEEIGNSPGANQFWATGNWQYNPTTNKYTWNSGKWTTIDPKWVLIPGHYLVLPEGYTYIPPYWDWPIDQIGHAYRCSQGVVSEYTMTNSQPNVTDMTVIDPAVIITGCVCYYPDYLYFYHHYHHFHPDFWNDCACSPPWWGWTSWWSYSWHRQWGAWWWYSHPGYPQPDWFTPEISGYIPPPSPKLIASFGKISTPIFVTTKGVVSPSQLRVSIVGALKDRGVTQTGNLPIVPANQKILQAIQSKSESNLKLPEKIIFPKGDPKKMGTSPPANTIALPGVKHNMPVEKIEKPVAKEATKTVTLPEKSEHQKEAIEQLPKAVHGAEEHSLIKKQGHHQEEEHHPEEK